MAGASDGHDDGGRQAQELGCGSHALGVIAGGIGDDATLAATLFDQMLDLVEGAAELERAGALKQLRLYQHAPADALVQPRQFQQGRLDGLARDAPRRRLDIGDGGKGLRTER